MLAVRPHNRNLYLSMFRISHMLVRVMSRPTMILYGIDNIRDLFGYKVRPLLSQAMPRKHTCFPWTETCLY
jgi:hypothetical protein